MIAWPSMQTAHSSCRLLLEEVCRGRLSRLGWLETPQKISAFLRSCAIYNHGNINDQHECMDAWMCHMCVPANLSVAGLAQAVEQKKQTCVCVVQKPKIVPWYVHSHIHLGQGFKFVRLFLVELAAHMSLKFFFPCALLSKLSHAQLSM